MPRVDIDGIAPRTGSGYPSPFDRLVAGRSRKRLGDAADLTQFGVNLTTLSPGSATAHRHWHMNEDEFVFVLSGEATLIEDGGETTLRAGEAAGFKAGVPNGHHIVNRSDRDVTLLEIGTRAPSDKAEYPDIDLRAEVENRAVTYTHKDGAPY